MQRPIPCLFMRGGTSRGPFFDEADLPADVSTRDRVLLAVMGSPDRRQIDGLGGAHPLTEIKDVCGDFARLEMLLHDITFYALGNRRVHFTVVEVVPMGANYHVRAWLQFDQRSWRSECDAQTHVDVY